MRRPRRWLVPIPVLVLVGAAAFVVTRLDQAKGPGAAGPTIAQAPPAGESEVVWVIDGDTVDVLVDGQRRRVRLLNVDAPEEASGDAPAECLAWEAIGFLNDLIPKGTKVHLEYDEERTDRYGRDLAGVYVGEVLVNAEIARAGLATPVVFEPNRRFVAEVEAAYEEARAAQVGLFAPALDCAE